MYHILFIQSSSNGHLGCFHFLALVNNAALKFHVQVFGRHIFSIVLDIYLLVEFLGQVVTPCLTF